MPFLVRPAQEQDIMPLHTLAVALCSQGFLTLPSDLKEMEALLDLSERSFRKKLTQKDEGQYVFVLENLKERKIIGLSLIIACHGSPESPHLYFQVDSEKSTLTFHADPRGRTELGGLVLEPSYRGHPAKLGKALSLIRFLYIQKNSEKFHDDLLAELLPPFTPDGKSPFWESLGRGLTGLDYQEVDQRSRQDKHFLLSLFPPGPILISSLSPEAQKVIGVVGTQTLPVVKILTSLGFCYLHQIDPLDGGPHYGLKKKEVRYDLVQKFFEEQAEMRTVFDD